MKLTMGRTELDLPGAYLGDLRDANALARDRAALAGRFEEDGYWLLRGFFDPDTILPARRRMLEILAETGRLDPDAPLLEGRAAPGAHGMMMSDRKDFMKSAELLAVVENPRLMQFFADWFEADVLTFPYKWLRAVGPGDFTGCHYDVVYMGRGTNRLLTCWIPYGKVTFDMGPLAILSGSHHLERIKATYGRMDVDRDNVDGWFTNDPKELVDQYGGKWLTTEFEPGDILIFGMFTMHGSLTNTSDRFRLTSDTRYQPAGEPADERWIGDEPMAHYAWLKETPLPMEEARKRWGV